jgi:hypothetical protein
MAIVRKDLEKICGWIQCNNINVFMLNFAVAGTPLVM